MLHRFRNAECDGEPDSSVAVPCGAVCNSHRVCDHTIFRSYSNYFCGDGSYFEMALVVDECMDLAAGEPGDGYMPMQVQCDETRSTIAFVPCGEWRDPTPNFTALLPYSNLSRLARKLNASGVFKEEVCDLQCVAVKDGGGSELTDAEIAGIAIGCTVFGIMIFACAVMMWSDKQARHVEPASDVTSATEYDAVSQDTDNEQ